MFKQVFLWVITCIGRIIQVLRSFVLDESLGITFFHFLIFVIFFRFTLFIISFIKQVQEIQNENQKEFEESEKVRYNNWLRSHIQTKRR